MKSFLKSFLKFYTISVISAGYVLAFFAFAFFNVEDPGAVWQFMKLTVLISLIPCLIPASLWALFDYN